MTHRQATWETGRNTDSISTPAYLLYLQVTVKVIELEKVTLNEIERLRLFLNTLTVDDKYSLLSRDNSMQTIQMQLSEKQKTFS